MQVCWQLSGTRNGERTNLPASTAEQREGPRTLEKPNLKPDTQARRTSLGIFFPFAPCEEGSDTVQGWPG